MENALRSRHHRCDDDETFLFFPDWLGKRRKRTLLKRISINKIKIHLENVDAYAICWKSRARCLIESDKSRPKFGNESRHGGLQLWAKLLNWNEIVVLFVHLKELFCGNARQMSVVTAKTGKESIMHLHENGNWRNWWTANACFESGTVLIWIICC